LPANFLFHRLLPAAAPDNQAVNAGSDAIMAKFLQSILINRVEIGHETRGTEVFYSVFGGIQTNGGGNAIFQRFEAGALNVAPSAIGSENGMPSSAISQPHSANKGTTFRVAAISDNQQ